MSKLIITRGYPASGKTTFATQWVNDDPIHRLRVNRDELRHNLFDTYTGLTWEQEQTVTTVQQAAVRSALESGHDVIVDDTNLRLKHARAWADLAQELGSEFEVEDILTDAQECIVRDYERWSNGGRRVGESVIMNFAGRYRMPWPKVTPTGKVDYSALEQYEPKLGPPAWIFDIDGTLAHMNGRSPYDYTDVSNDVPDRILSKLARILSGTGYHIIVLSGRTDDARVDTEAWLDQHAIPWHSLFMRNAGDNRKDWIVKYELFKEHVEPHFNVQGVFDDRTQVVKMWRAIGLKCFQVADGDF